MGLPRKVVILGKTYTIEYVDNPAEVDILKREALWGQIDYWTRTIRIYKNKRELEDVWVTIIHEVLHGILTDLQIKALKEQEDDIALLSLGLTDTLIRNGWLRLSPCREEGKKDLGGM